MAERKALLVALDEYPDPANNLRSCIADARAFGRELRGRYGFTEIESLYNERATLENVQRGLDWLCERVGPDDRLVFFFSGHGYRAQKSNTLQEVLCCYDDFLFDDALIAASRQLPSGVFTTIMDSCHSGGMHELVVTGSRVEITPTKVLRVPPSAKRDQVFPDQGRLARLRYKPFGGPVADVSAIAGRLRRGASSGRSPASAELLINGLLLSASLVDEATPASSTSTQGTSAFTFALLEQLDALGPGVSNRRLRAGIEAKLRALGFRQTPILVEGRSPGKLEDRRFLLLQPTS